MEHLIAAACFIGLSLWISRRRTSKPPLPPGPPADPLIGHLRVVPHEKAPEAFHEWSKKYGDVIYLEALGRKIVVLGSLEAAQALLDNRGANYSCRPTFPLYKIMGWEPILTMLQYGKRFLKHRRMLQQYLGGQKESLSFDHIIAEEARLLVKNFSNAAPGTHRDYLQRYTVSNIMRAAFGHQVRSSDDAFLKIANDLTASIHASGPPGSTAIDVFPWLRYMPLWFPGNHYLSVALASYETTRRLFEYPLEFVRDRMKTQNYEKSFLSEKLEECEGNMDPEHLEDIKGAAAALFIAGEDTTYASLQIFCLTMLLHPEYQQRAYEEIVSVLGPNTIPDLNDRKSLPFVEGIVQEVLRWSPVAPLGIPHRVINDDVYNGMFIPKGATVIANIRGMSRNEKVYSNPDVFDPTRFLPQPQGRGEPHFSPVWGFGRRICPGRHFADMELWYAMACTLATLEITPGKDDTGNLKLPEEKWSDGIVREPFPFEFEVTPRSGAAAKLIAQIES